MTKQELKLQKAQFKITGIPEEFKGHKWKRGTGITTCKVCGLVKGSGFAKCEPQLGGAL